MYGIAMIILIMGLPSSGKTTLAKELYKRLDNCDWFNADEVRKQCNDWDFSNNGRINQANRMKNLAIKSKAKYVICDFVAPTNETRAIFNADITVWLDTTKECRFKDTESIFVPPSKYDFKIETKDAANFAVKLKDFIEGK
jgi:adenylylsulfate kinase